MIDLRMLSRPLDPALVAEREGPGGRTLAYLPSHVVIAQANRAFGFGSWGYEVKDLKLLGTQRLPRRTKAQDGGRVAYGGEGTRVAYLCLTEVTVAGQESVEDVGFGDASEYSRYEDQPAPELEPHELASKEAVSDAVKRCLRCYGPQFGLSLYSKDTNWKDSIWSPPPGRTRVGVNEILAQLEMHVGDDSEFVATTLVGLGTSVWGASDGPRPRHQQEDITERLHQVLWALGDDPSGEQVFDALAEFFPEAGMTGKQLRERVSAPF